MDNENKEKASFSGNKYSLRAKSYDIIMRPKSKTFVSLLNKIGDFLFVTKGSAIIAFAVFVLAGVFPCFIIAFKHSQILLQNIPVILLLLIGSICLSLQVLIINPTSDWGFQLKVSMNFVMRKIRMFRDSKSHRVKLKPFKFAPEVDTKDVVIKNNGVEKLYIAGYSVVGIVSPNALERDLNQALGYAVGLLNGLEYDTTITKAVTIAKAVPKKLSLPENATESMKEEAERRYKRVERDKYSQNIVTHIYLSCPTLEILQKRRMAVEAQFRQGLVVGYATLADKELKQSIKKIFN